MSGKIPSEGVQSGVSAARLADVEAPNITDECWTEAGQVEQLFIYPVKSMRGVSVQSADVMINKVVPLYNVLYTTAIRFRNSSPNYIF